jgi:hypothetical protein
MSDQVAETGSELSPPRQLWVDTLEQIIAKLNLSEVTAADGGPHLQLESKAPMATGNVGNVRLFKGDHLFQLVTCSIVVPAIQLDSHMLFAFMPSQSAVPHFTLDSVRAGPTCAFHLDLIPRLDLGANLAYMDEVFTPLTEAYKQGNDIEGLSPAQLDPRQYAIMSPWMFVGRANDDAFAEIGGSVNQYLNHWLSLLDKGLSDEALAGASEAQIAARDAANKAIIFNPEVDKVWGQISGLIGADVAAEIRELLKQTS